MGIFSKMFNLNVKDEHTNTEQINRVKDTGDFCMYVDDVFYITGKGVVATGVVTSGTINLNDIVTVGSAQATVTGIEMFRKQLDYATKGDNAGLVLSGIDKNDVASGDLIKK